MAYFHLKPGMPGPSFPQDASPDEMTAMQAHFACRGEHAQKGVAIAVGPVFAEGGAFDMAEVADAAEALSLVDGAPMIKAGLGFRFEISPMPSIILRTSAGGAAAAG